MSTNDCDPTTTANDLFTSLTAGLPTVPTIDLTSSNYDYTPDLNGTLYTAPADITLADLTITTVDGTGVFDKLMLAVNNQLEVQMNQGHITGDQFAEVYTASISSVLSAANQFLLTKDRAKWESIQAQMSARVAEIQATIAKVELAKSRIDAAKATYDMNTAGAQFALTKMQAANASEEHCLIAAQSRKEAFTADILLPITQAQETKKLNCIIPFEIELLGEQIQKERAQTLDTRRDGITPIGGLMEKQKELLAVDLETKNYNLASMLPEQLAALQEQVKLVQGQVALVNEQSEAERAKTLDTRSDGSTPVSGSVGKQKDLYTQQIDSFVKDAKHKTAKMYLDAWITQKTLDEGLLAPNELQNATVDSVMSSVRTTNGLV